MIDDIRVRCSLMVTSLAMVLGGLVVVTGAVAAEEKAQA